MRHGLFNVFVELLQRTLSERVRCSASSCPGGGWDAIRGLALELIGLALQLLDTLLAILNRALDALEYVLFVCAELAVRQLAGQTLKHAEKVFQLLNSVSDVGFLGLVRRIEVDEGLRDLDAQRNEASPLAATVSESIVGFRDNLDTGAVRNSVLMTRSVSEGQESPGDSR